MPSARPFADLTALIDDMPAPDAQARAALLARVEAASPGAGGLAALAGWMAEWRGADIAVRKPIVALYVSAEEGASGDPAAAAQARLEHLAAGGGAISPLARAQGAGVEVFDLGSARPSPDPLLRASMSERECAATLAFGMEALAKGPDLLIVGDAAGPSASAFALAWALCDVQPPQADRAWCEAVLARGRTARAATPLDWLRQIGGREIAALAGALVAARTQRTPVLIEGAPALAACAVLSAMNPDALDHVRLGAAPLEPATAELARRLALAPLTDLGIAAGEGAAAMPALALVKLAAALAAT